ncbi:HlyD family efflux transporter periplasmic adaptor subunit [Carboxylicivirga mesophila]|uniref:HlyD family efflux transporter periplasmic adaptor subunit n=1 Tax=Carboxylicivirga mesophila TaxID=1166478 RepID=A0ABS5KFA3_9BACT|nr:HlyD family efflux transporter periplasmic adaptor subunit [Carboxylicivirga mesophila]MBS2213517.1 HlyD family efflux transporter periplasmic adaptor subunit [Carboxylicivirga mesophila]
MPTDTPKFDQLKNKFNYYSANFYRGYALYWVILVILLLTFCALPFIYVDVSVQSRGIITSENKKVAIVSPLTARVVDCYIKENAKVSKADTLVRLHQSGIQNEMAINHQQIVLQQNYVADLSVLLKERDTDKLLTSLYKKERDEYTNTLNAYQGKIQKLNIDFDRTAELYAAGVVPLTTFQEDSFKLDVARNELLTFQTSTKARWESERRDYTLAIHELEGRIEQLRQQQNQYIITAPFAGSLIDFMSIAPGHILNENQHIAYLSPEEELIAECYVSPADIGFIHPGMAVQLQIDTYDYNQWGLLSAQVMEVADDVVLMNDTYRYLIRCRLSDDHLKLKNDVEGSLRKGMSLTGRFVITQRSLFQLLFDNVDDWLNPKIINDTKTLNLGK